MKEVGLEREKRMVTMRDMATSLSVGDTGGREMQTRPEEMQKGRWGRKYFVFITLVGNRYTTRSGCSWSRDTRRSFHHIIKNGCCRD